MNVHSRFCVCAISGEKFHSFYFIFRYCFYHQMMMMMMMISNLIDHQQQQNQNPDDTFMVYINLIGFFAAEIIITTTDDSSLEHSYKRPTNELNWMFDDWMTRRKNVNIFGLCETIPKTRIFSKNFFFSDWINQIFGLCWWWWYETKNKHKYRKT